MRLLLALVMLSGCARNSGEPPPPPRYELSVSERPGGVVTSEPGGISCGTVCSARFSRGTVVTLRAVPDPGVEFAGWQGGCAGRSLCVVSMSNAISLQPRFVLAGTNEPVPESKRKPSDLDGDGVSDAVDECPVEAGNEETHGCPSDS